ncbi:uncharacterized protein PV09_06931 [Verruconis gallopava]|uniref:Fcf2 pre-rRNA processing C-terminal domain-containing protein n=1 Tax=Verruconis gallopava TaxID=253628 RepID=A0A0D2A5D7_9PEZI|nr:uncharacterized protein PV09_06931 [Verruconis gallopava]KIW01755.1 hypothetical protein PV09_06931 [Verruconis gallopava]
MDFDDSSRTLSAGSIVSEETLVPEEQDDLSDEQIDFLLHRASLRMKGQNGALVTAQGPSSTRLPTLKAASELPRPYTSMVGGVAKVVEAKSVSEELRRMAEKPKRIEDPVALRREKKEPKPVLSDWYNLPRTNLTTELKRDLQLLNMRSVLDPKRMYRKQGKFKVPEYSQVGVVVEGPTEFYSARIENKQRKQTFVEEVLAGEKESGRFKSKYEELQAVKKSGKKGYYKSLQQARRKARKGG